MSKRLEITEAFLRLLVNSSRPKRKILLQGATNEQYKGLFELCLNLLRGNLPLSGKDQKQFHRQRYLIRDLANKRISIKKKKELINQRGGALIASLATFALPLVAQLIASGVKRVVSQK